MPSKETFCLEVTGDFACFTRPEMKVERVSYDVITPSAARAVFEAILWKPAMSWHITKIEILKPISWVNIRRNEVASVISVDKVKQVINGSNMDLHILIEDDRQQRAGLFLRDVAYRLYARFSLRDDSTHIHHYPHLQCADADRSENTYMKFAEMFKRRASKGQCFNQPYLGTREFSANWRLIEVLDQEPPALQFDQDRSLGWMLYDMDFSNPSKPSPLFFNAILKKDGSIDIPSRDSEEVRG